ncbi:MAG: helix-turn-helix domain-containing protein [Aerococcaceae bacterium]|nr:helix-turn-helix domain-containing protein [Aerococcaceae bacterium]
MLQIDLPKSFNEEFIATIRKCYTEAFEQARRDFLISKEFLTFPELLRYADITRNTANNWIMAGLPKYQIDGKMYVKKSEVISFIEAHQVN